MDSFYIITNGAKDRDLSVTGRIEAYLKKQNKNCIVNVTDASCQGSYIQEKAVPEHVDCVIVLGGDGTLIQAARDMVNRDVVMVGVNLGTLGFLTDVETDNLENALDHLMTGEYEIEERMMLDGTVEATQGRKRSIALNDVVINRYGSLRIITYKLYVNGKFLASYQADGIIISTPTGSTGYSLSAGGPIIEPKARMILITPICPHTLNSRSVILSPEDIIRIEVAKGGGDERNLAEVSFDGTEGVRMDAGDSVTVSTSLKTTKIVKINKEGFLTVLRNKLSC